jgi:hypothetical protein
VNKVSQRAGKPARIIQPGVATLWQKAMRQQILRMVVLGLITLFAGAPRIGLAAEIDRLPSWNAGSAKQSIVELVAKVTKEGTPEFVPVAERIAVTRLADCAGRPGPSGERGA